MAGRCLTELRRPERAIPLLGQAIEQYDQAHSRELALYLSWLAEAHIQQGNIDEAAAIASRSLDLSSAVTSARGVARVQVLRRLLAPYHGTSAVDDFECHAATVSCLEVIQAPER
jgi:tetratricopeptide (TPR) repeat protein